ncbi:hypothetical protein Hanom_Chr12g01140891 [Helianthus anomalus]
MGFSCGFVLSFVRTKTRITFKPLTRLTFCFFLHDRNLTFYHVNLKSPIWIKEILNLRAIGLLFIYDLFDPFMISSNNTFVLAQNLHELYSHHTFTLAGVSYLGFAHLIPFLH